MQLKGLLRIFTVLLVLICLYQLSFTWIVRSHEKELALKADKYIKSRYPKPAAKYPGDASLQSAYADTLKELTNLRMRRLEDSTSGQKIGPFDMITYQNAKEKELQLGLDLQGGMAVTMEVGTDGLIRSLANYSKDASFNNALAAAVNRKANGGADLISLFQEEYSSKGNGARLAPLFAQRSNSRITFEDSDDKVIGYLRDQANIAFENTYKILRTRIDRFGVASPSINKDPAKGIISIELAGVNNPERVRNYLQSTANLQFFEVYTTGELGESILGAEKSLSDYLNGVTVTTDSLGNKDSVSTVQNNTGKDSATIKFNQAPLRSLIQFTDAQADDKGNRRFPANIGFVAVADTGRIGDFLRLDFVKSRFPSNLSFAYGKLDSDVDNPQARNYLQLYALRTLENGAAELEGEHVVNARQDYDARGRVAIKMEMDAVGTRIWAKMTRNNVGKPLAIVLDNVVYSAPFVNGEIPNGSSEISGSYSVVEAQDMSDILQSGKLPAPAKIVQEQVVGPTLGQDAITGGTLSFAISFLVIFALMLVYFNTAGWVANIALILNLLFTIGILSALGFTLTAPGIAGLVLTIGLAVDTNVIIFERIKDELNRGKSYQLAVNDGYKKSYAPVLDGHITTLLTAIILAYFGLGPVLGFATTQIIGILLSLFCGIIVSRLISDWYTRKNRHFEYFTPLSRKVFAKAKFRFVEYRKVAYIISGIVLILGLAALYNGFDEGVEFAGGRSYTVKFAKKPAIESIRQDLTAVFEEAPIIKTVGSADQLNITTAYRINERSNQELETAVEQKLFEGLKNHLPGGTSFANFQSAFKQSSQTVQPTISSELKAGATKATAVAIIAICLYIFIRFRDWRYSLGTVMSLLHDVFVTMAVFSFCRSIVPFPLEIDQHFIAAILTVIGFSMNDTVIVYDRIREDSRLMPDASKETVINTAINQTLSRTIMTSLTVFLTILILFIFGGEVTRGFAFAMLVGVITGTYSSIFVAAPILVDFAKDKPLGRPARERVLLAEDEAVAI